MHREVNKYSLVFGIIALAGIAQFFYSLPQAMRVYPDGYSITSNFLSDLGCVSTSGGQDNSASATIFNRSIMLLGVSLMPFFCAMSYIFERSGWMIRTAGVLSALGLVGVGLTPYDYYLVEHFLALGIWLGPMLFMVIAVTFCAELDRMTSLALVLCTLLVVTAAGIFVFAGDREGHVIFQKVLAVIAVVWFCLVFMIVTVSTVRSIPSARLVAERQARQYLRTIERNHRRRQHASRAALEDEEIA